MVIWIPANGDGAAPARLSVSIASAALRALSAESLVNTRAPSP